MGICKKYLPAFKEKGCVNKSVGCNAEERKKSYFWKRSIIVDSCELMFSQFKNKCKVNMVLSYYHKKYVLFFIEWKIYFHNIWLFDQWNIKSYNSKCKRSPYDFHFPFWINHQDLYFSIFSLSLKKLFSDNIKKYHFLHRKNN